MSESDAPDTATSTSTDRINEDPDGTLDDMVITRPHSVHLENLEPGVWWLGIARADGTVMHLAIEGSVTITDDGY